MTSSKPLTFIFQDDGKALPVLVYKDALDLNGNGDPRAFETRFAENGWGRDQWRNGIYPFVHYHSMIHEALGIARGHARVQLGGHSGEVFELAAGDAGGHRASEAFRQRRFPGHRRLSAGWHL